MFLIPFTSDDFSSRRVRPSLLSSQGVRYPLLLTFVPLLVLVVHEELLVRIQSIPRISYTFHCCFEPRLLSLRVKALKCNGIGIALELIYKRDIWPMNIDY